MFAIMTENKIDGEYFVTPVQKQLTSWPVDIISREENHVQPFTSLRAGCN